MTRVLAVDYEKCTGCRLCELVCSVRHEGVSNPARSRIRIVKWEWEGIYVPVVSVKTHRVSLCVLPMPESRTKSWE